LKTHERVAFIVIQICAFLNIHDPRELSARDNANTFRFPVDLIEPHFNRIIDYLSLGLSTSSGLSELA